MTRQMVKRCLTAAMLLVIAGLQKGAAMAETEQDKQRTLRHMVFSDAGQAEAAIRRDPSLLQTRDGAGETVFQYAVVENRIDLAQLLLEWGSDINTRSYGGATPLMDAAAVGHIEMVKWLVQHGADIELKDDLEETALSKATRNDYAEVFHFLLSLPRKHEIDFYYDDLSAHDVFENRTLVMRETLIQLGLSERFKE